MTEPFVFHFKPGPQGRIEAMYMLDLDCACGLCGHEQLQRFYHSTPFHELTVPTLEQLADSAALKAGYECENCGEAVGADEVRHSCLTFGFADDAGIIRIFDDLSEQARSVELTARRRLDPQAMPRWSADPEAHGEGHWVVDELDERTVRRRLGRPINAKLAWRDFLSERLEADSTAGWTRIATGLWAVAAPDVEAAREVADGIDDEQFQRTREDGELAAAELDDAVPDGLPTHPSPTTLEGAWQTWLPEPVVDALEADRLCAVAHVDRRPVVETIERTFEVGRLDWETRTDDGIVYADLTTPTDTTFDEPLPVESVVRRAVHTGLTPGEAARLTAEEIVGTLMQVW